jgi:FlaG/FlaF family flagellin (archaellin)
MMNRAVNAIVGVILMVFIVVAVAAVTVYYVINKMSEVSETPPEQTFFNKTGVIINSCYTKDWWGSEKTIVTFSDGTYLTIRVSNMNISCYSLYITTQNNLNKTCTITYHNTVSYRDDYECIKFEVQ